MRIVEPDYIIDAWDQIDPYIEIVEGEPRVKEDAPYYIKDAYMALLRRAKWMSEYEASLMFDGPDNE